MLGLLLPPWVNRPAVLPAVLAILAKTVGFCRLSLPYTAVLPSLYRQSVHLLYTVETDVNPYSLVDRCRTVGYCRLV